MLLVLVMIVLVVVIAPVGQRSGQWRLGYQVDGFALLNVDPLRDIALVPRTSCDWKESRRRVRRLLE